MKEIDDTPVTESESDYDHEYSERCILDLWSAFTTQSKNIDHLLRRIKDLEAEVADLHHRRRVSRQQAVDQDPEWYA